MRSNVPLPTLAKPSLPADFLANIKTQSLEEKQRIRDNFNSSKGFFGVPLDHECPIVVCDCIAYLRNRSFSEEGVFRIPGNQDVVNNLKNSYNEAFSDKLSKEESQVSILNCYRPSPSVNDVASLLKNFFGGLPEALIPPDISAALLKVNSHNLPEDVEIKWYAKILRRMPVPNRECFSLLISFLREIILFKKFNQMTADNLAMCFVLVVMGKVDASQQLMFVANGTKVLKTLMLHNFTMKMPSLSNMKKCTKYIDMIPGTEGPGTELMFPLDALSKTPNSKDEDENELRDTDLVVDIPEPAPNPNPLRNGMTTFPPSTKSSPTAALPITSSKQLNVLKNKVESEKIL